MKILTLCFILIVEITLCHAQEIQPQFTDTIRTCFEEAKASAASNKALWNYDVYAPILFVDRQSRKLYSNENDSLGTLKASSGIYTGLLPTNVNMANTSINWGGKHWAMIMLPL